jgi:DNA modification methylase
VELWGDPTETAAIGYALDVRSDEGTRDHVHGFHSYPARMHPLTACRLIEKLSTPGSVLLDPFCGSGTVLVEGRLAGRSVIGVDANPLAIELAWLKTRAWSERERRAVIEGAQSATTFAEARRQRRSGSTHRYGAEDVSLFDPHVLLELDGLRAGLARIPSPTTRRALSLVLSSILIKVSRRPGDTAPGQTARRLASGFTIRMFGKKADELVRRLAEISTLLPAGKHDLVQTRTGDARKLEGIANGSVDLIVTSPPYPGNYDYLSHHEARLRWLGLDREELARIELGARRHLEPLPESAAAARWAGELGDVLRAMSRVLAPGGRIALVLGDSVIRRRPIFADELVRKLAPQSALVMTASGSQSRPHFHGGTARAYDRSPRREHVLVCRHRDSVDAPAAPPKVR